MAWRDHVAPGEKHTVLSEYDDGSAILLGWYSGGKAKSGAWGELSLMKIEADGKTTHRSYKATTGWADLVGKS